MPVDSELKELFLRYQETFTDFDGIAIEDVNQPGMGEDRLLHLAANHCDCRDVELLLKKGAEVNLQGDIGLTPLHYAASKGKLDVVKVLIRYGADVYIENEFGERPIDWARNANQKEVVKFLDSLPK